MLCLIEHPHVFEHHLILMLTFVVCRAAECEFDNLMKVAASVIKQGSVGAPHTWFFPRVSDGLLR